MVSTMDPAQRPVAPDRRDFLGGAALLALALGVPAGTLSLIGLDEASRPTPRQGDLLREVSQLVIPRGNTPGAGDIGVAEFVALALAHGLLGTGGAVAGVFDRTDLASFARADGTLRYLDWLEAQLDRRAGGDFLRASSAQRGRVLVALDAEAFPSGPPTATPSPWQAIKALILTGYYTSQIGGAQELRYELTPGRFDPDLPLNPLDRAWSSDWTAVDFG